MKWYGGGEGGTLISKYSPYTPALKARYWGGLQLRGKKVDHEDVSKFVLRGSKYIPLMFAGDLQEGDKVINMLPSLCVGAAEVLSEANVDLFELFCFIADKIGTADISKIYDVIDKEFNGEFCEDRSNNLEFFALCSMRYSRKNFDRISIKSIVNLLFLLYYTKPELFSEALVTVSSRVYEIIPRFCDDFHEYSKDDLKIVMEIVGDLSKGVAAERPFGTIGYKQPNGTRLWKISDDTGFGICMFSIFVISLFRECGDDYSGRLVGFDSDYDKYLDALNKTANRCIGNDYTGSFYKGAEFKFKEYEDMPAFFSAFYEGINLPFYSTEFKVGNNSIHKDRYEEGLLFCKSSGFRDSFSFIHKLPTTVDMHYSSYAGIRADAMTLCCHTDDVSCEQDVFDFSALFESAGIKKVSHFSELNEKAGAGNNRHVEQELKRLNSELTSLRVKYNSACESIESMKKSHEEEVHNLLYRLSSKDDIISALQEKYNSVSTEIKSYYCDEVTEGEKDGSVSAQAELSIEDMVKFLNTKTVLVLGGHDNFMGSVNAKGLTNIIRFDKATDMKSSVPSVDYISIHTRFVSHNLIETAKDRYRDSSDITFYYNGTSADGFIRAYYDFVCRQEKG